MGRLNACLVLGLVALPLAAAASCGDVASHAYRSFLEESEKAIGHNVDWEHTLKRTVTFNWPADAIGMRAGYATVTGMLTAGPVFGAPDTGAKDGCVVANPGAADGDGLLGYGQIGVGVGNHVSGCPYALNPGGVDDYELICISQPFCEQAVIEGTHVQGELIVSCQNAFLVYSAQPARQQTPPAGTGTCQLFGFYLEPPDAWEAHFDLARGSNSLGVVVGLVNG